MSRRFLALLALLLLAVLLAGWLWRGRAAAVVELPRAKTNSSGDAALPISAQSSQARSIATDPSASEFELLPTSSGDLLVQFRDGTTLDAVPGAEVFLLEGAEPGWPRWDLRSESPPVDFEAELRAHGRRLASDEHGDLHLRSPRFPLRLIGRKGELFGGMCLGADDERPTTVWMYRSAVCIVRVRDPRGQPVAEAPIEIGTRATDEVWRGRCDAAGECRVPNFGWVLRNYGPDEGWAYATVEGSSCASATDWMRVEEPAPGAIDLVLEPAARFTLRIAASDGTPVPIAGSLYSHPPLLAGQGRPPSKRNNPRSIPIVRGEASFELGAPGSWIDCAVQLADGVEFVRSVRMPDLGAAPAAVDLRIPEGVQILLAHAVDEQQQPLARAQFEWVVCARSEGDGLDHEALVDAPTSDGEGLLVLAVPRKLLADGHRMHARGRLRLRAGGNELEGPALDLVELGNAPVRDLGPLVFGPAQVLASGRVVDDLGQPVSGVWLRLRGVSQLPGDPKASPVMLRNARAQTKSDAEGRFQFFGDPVEARYLIEPWRSGYSMPREAQFVRFDPANPSELLLTLMRDGEVRVCVDLPRRLARDLYWQILSADGTGGQSLALGPKDGTGRIQREVRNLLPGTYRALLVDPEIDSVLVQFENVLVRPGERTNDPRLCGVDLSAVAALAKPQPVGGNPAASIVLEIVDPSARPIPEGRTLPGGLTRDGDTFWHAGRVLLDASARGKEIAVWSPGFRAWVGTCPQSSTKLRLEPAPRLTLRVAIPSALQRPDCRFRIWPMPAGGSSLALDLVRGLAPAELDAQGVASFDCPAEGTVQFNLQMLALDSTGNVLREGAMAEPVASLHIELPASGEERIFPVAPEEWDAARKLLVH